MVVPLDNVLSATKVSVLSNNAKLAGETVY
jgi:hypothetical protein